MKLFCVWFSTALILVASCASEAEAPSVDVELSNQASYTSVCGDTLAFNDATAERLYEAAQAHIGPPWEGRLWGELAKEERDQWSTALDVFLTNDACSL